MFTLAFLVLASPEPPCFTHERTGVVFAAAPAGFVCSGPRVLDPERDEVSVAYKNSAEGHTIALSVYVYQKALPCCSPNATVDEHLADVRRAVEQRYVDLQCEDWSPPG